MPVTLPFHDELLRKAGGYSICGMRYPNAQANVNATAPEPSARKFSTLVC